MIHNGMKWTIILLENNQIIFSINIAKSQIQSYKVRVNKNIYRANRHKIRIYLIKNGQKDY